MKKYEKYFAAPDSGILHGLHDRPGLGGKIIAGTKDRLEVLAAHTGVNPTRLLDLDDSLAPRRRLVRGGNFRTPALKPSHPLDPF